MMKKSILVLAVGIGLGVGTNLVEANQAPSAEFVMRIVREAKKLEVRQCSQGATIEDFAAGFDRIVERVVAQIGSNVRWELCTYERMRQDPECFQSERERLVDLAARIVVSTPVCQNSPARRLLARAEILRPAPQAVAPKVVEIEEHPYWAACPAAYVCP